MKPIRFTLIMALGLMLVMAPTLTLALDTDLTVSMNFEDTPLSAVLKMLATQNNLNLVVSSAVEGDISISLDNVSLKSALDALLLPNGYDYYINDDIIIVKDANQQLAGELIPQTYRLKYIDAASAVEAIKPMLSANGKITILAPAEEQVAMGQSSRQSQFVVFDRPETHRAIADFLPQIDRKKRQVSVEVKLIETNLTDEEKLGINWPKSVAAALNGATTPGSSTEFGGNEGTEAGVMPLENGNWQLGYLSVHQMDIVMDFLRLRNNSKLLSNPRVTTMEDETATIQISTVIPIQTINRFSEGAVIQDIVTFQDEEVGISLKVNPHIIDDSAITMLVNPIVQEIIGYSGTSPNQKPITSERSVNTTVTVKNNETIALGGLLKETRIEREEKVFLLGSIPILGALFTNRGSEVQTTDLLILITPQIVD